MGKEIVKTDILERAAYLMFMASSELNEDGRFKYKTKSILADELEQLSRLLVEVCNSDKKDFLEFLEEY